VFIYTPDIVASFSIQQLRIYKSYAYKWDYISCSQGNGLKPTEYDEIFATESVMLKNRKNSYNKRDKMLPAIAALNAEGIANPNMKQVNSKINELIELNRGING